MALLPCDGCSRHVREEDASCPFCGASKMLAARRAPHLASVAMALLGAGLTGCGGLPRAEQAPSVTAAPSPHAATESTARAPAPPPGQPAPERTTRAPAPSPAPAPERTAPAPASSPGQPAPERDPNRFAAAYGAPPVMLPQAPVPVAPPPGTAPAPVAPQGPRGAPGTR